MKKNNKLNLNLYSYGFSLNFLKLKETKINLHSLISQHNICDLNGIEFPIDTLFKNSNNAEFFFKKYQNQYQYNICFDDINNVNYSLLNLIKKYGNKNIRIRLPQVNKTIYGGNKFLISNFKTQIEIFKNKIKSFKKYFLDNNMYFCIENHQDLNSFDLLKIIEELGSDYIGINWDIGNSISCGETPNLFYKNVSNFIKNIHLKDYKVYFDNRIVYLTRCPFGQGFLRNFNVKKYAKTGISKSIELGSQITRKCYVSNKKYWKFNNISNTNKNKYFDLIHLYNTKMKNLSDYENNLSYDEIKKNEFNDFIISYNYLKKKFNV